MFCKKCGQQVSDGVKFCIHCGTPVDTPPNGTLPKVNAPAQTISYEVVRQRVPVRKKKKPLAVLAVLAALIIVVAATLLLTAKKTVYLPTKTVSIDPNGIISTYRYDYDDQGRITRYVQEREYPEEYAYNADTRTELRYQYAEDGKLRSAIIKVNDTVTEVEYVYSGDTPTCFVVDSEDYSGELEIECDSKGRIVEITPVEADTDLPTLEYTYYDNGIVKSRIVETSMIRAEAEYNQQGNTLEYRTYMNGELVSHSCFDYDARGNLTLQETYGRDHELLSRMEYAFNYEKDQLTGMTMIISEPDSYGGIEEIEVTFECEWDGLECEMTVADVSGDNTLSLDDLLGDLVEIYFEVDEAGNLLSYEMIVDGDTNLSTSKEYAEYRVPRNYQQVNVTVDPMYLYFLN